MNGHCSAERLRVSAPLGLRDPGKGMLVRAPSWASAAAGSCLYFQQASFQRAQIVSLQHLDRPQFTLKLTNYLGTQGPFKMPEQIAS